MLEKLEEVSGGGDPHAAGDGSRHPRRAPPQLPRPRDQRRPRSSSSAAVASCRGRNADANFTYALCYNRISKAGSTTMIALLKVLGKRHCFKVEVARPTDYNLDARKARHARRRRRRRRSMVVARSSSARRSRSAVTF
jgi:hypothetical protein